MVIEQFLPGFHYGDAIGNSVLNFHKFLLKKGIKSRIVAELIDEEVKEFCTPFYEYTENESSIKIYHYALASPLNKYFMKNSGKKVIVYHNITPSEYFEGFSEELVKATSTGRDELIDFADKFDLAVADSNYNASELKEIGFKNIRTFPIMISRDDYIGGHSEGYIKGYGETYSDNRKNILFVGRISPNKKIEDLLKFISLYNKTASEKARMIIAGNIKSVPEYFAAIMNLSGELGLSTSDLFITGHIQFSELLSMYKSADVFLSMSEHEGFCLPLVESSFFKLPVIAYDAGAVRETLDGSGILFSKKELEKIVFLTERVLSDKKVKDELANSAEGMVARYEKSSDPELLLNILTEEFNG
ncbi:MAG: glycosyltransferase [Acidobacteriota bacterium]